jgi:hypothetical protein
MIVYGESAYCFVSKFCPSIRMGVGSEKKYEDPLSESMVFWPRLGPCIPHEY